MNLSREEFLSRLRDMNGHQFEELVADIWEQRGWETTVTAGSGDDGIDIIVEKDSPFDPNQKHVIQAKCYSDTSVGGPELRDFGGAIDLADADAGVFLTTSSFSSSAERTADGLNSKVNIIDGEDLCDLILDLENPQQFLSEYIDTDSNSVNPKARAREVEKAFLDFFGVEIDLIGIMSDQEQTAGFLSDEGIITELSEEAKEIVYSGFKHVSVQEQIADTLKELDDSSNVAEDDLSVREVIAILIENGGMERAWNEAHERTLESDPNTQLLLGLVFLKCTLDSDAEKGDT